MKNNPLFAPKFFQQLIMNCKWNLIFILGFNGFFRVNGINGIIGFNWINRIITRKLKKNVYQQGKLTNTLKINKNSL